MMVQMNFARKYKCLSIIGRYISLHLFVLTRFFIGFRQWKIYLRVWSIWRHVLFNINFRLQRGKQILAPSWRTKWVEKALTGMSSDCEDDSRQISLLSHQVEDHRTKSRWRDWSLKSFEVLRNNLPVEVGKTSAAACPPWSSWPSWCSSSSPSFLTSSPRSSGSH